MKPCSFFVIPRPCPLVLASFWLAVTGFVLLALPRIGFAAIEGDFSYTVADNEATATAYLGVNEDVVIPATLGGYPVVVLDAPGRTRFFSHDVVSVSIPSSVTSIKGVVTHSTIEHIHVDPGNTVYGSDSGVLFNANLTSLIRYPAGRTDATYDVPDGVTSLEPEAFSFSTAVTRITIPDTVTSIGDGVFRNCKSLTSIDLPDTLVSIGNSVFSGCTGLSAIVLPTSVTSIGALAFQNCKSLTSMVIPDGISSIRSGTFSGCTSLTEVVIPDSVTSIQSSTFEDCVNLTNIALPESLSTISSGVFQGCVSLTRISLPESVAWIGISAFKDCTSLATVDLSESLMTIDYSAFEGCSSLTSISIPDSVTEIRNSSFRGCTNLTSINLGNRVTSIGNSAFEGCSSLTRVFIPASVESIESSAFRGCTDLAELDVHPESPHYASVSGVLFNKAQTHLLRYPPGKADPSYSIPETVTTVEHWAFYDCWKLADLSVPHSVAELGTFYFFDGPSLTNIFVDPANVSYASRSGVLFNADLTRLLRYPAGKPTATYAIPDTVTSIGSSAFSNSTGLVEISIPESVTIIRSSAFSGCTSLMNLNIPESVTSIQHWAFEGCTSLSSVVLSESVLSLGGKAFHDCTNLTSAVFRGDAPIMLATTSLVETDVFADTSPDFSVFYFDGAEGFTSPIWKGYPTVNLGPNRPFTEWLMEAELLSSDYTKPSDDLNHDGVSLLMAYALDLDPRDHLTTRLPTLHQSNDTLTMTFRGNRPGIDYAVQATSDLIHWDTQNVTLSEPDAEGMRTATAPIEGDALFLRLVVQELAGP